MSKLPSTSRGLALGGLAGNNAHGAGVLQAVLELAGPPEMISCSSGQIYWAHRYLTHLKKFPVNDRKGLLRKDLEAHIEDVRPMNIEPIDAGIVSLAGKPGVFRPAWAEFPLNVMRNFSGVFMKILTNATKNWKTVFSAYRELARVLPSQALIPLFPDRFFEEISDDFNGIREVGLLFNSFDIKSGKENVYCNECARDLLNIEFGDENRYRLNTIYQSITPEAVREGLWIYEYGQPQGVNAIDGAYYRQIILSELAPVHTIYVARPINSKWLGAFPDSWVGLQDLKTEVNFNGSYAGERDKIELINHLLEDSKVADEVESENGYHPIKIEPLEIKTQRGFFDYAQESLEVFDEAYRAARAKFAHEAIEVL